MFDANIFIEKLNVLEERLVKELRGEIEFSVEIGLTQNLLSVFKKMALHFDQFAKNDQEFPAMPEVRMLPIEQRCLQGLQILLGRMEEEFIHKLILDLEQGAENQVALSKIKLSCLDGVRRCLFIET